MLRPRARLAVSSVLALGLSIAACGTPVHSMPDAHTDFGPRTDASCPSTAVTYSSFGQAFFSTYCTSCHASTLAGAARIGAPVGFDFDTAAGVRARLVEIDQVAASGPSATNTTMPFAGTMPTLAERQTLGELLACGVPD